MLRVKDSVFIQRRIYTGYRMSVIITGDGKALGGAPIKLSSMFITPTGYKKYRHASWRTKRRSAVLPGR